MTTDDQCTPPFGVLTVAELVERLASYPSDMWVMVCDALNVEAGNDDSSGSFLPPVLEVFEGFLVLWWPSQVGDFRMRDLRTVNMMRAHEEREGDEDES